MDTACEDPGLRASMSAYLDGDQHAFAYLHRRLAPILRHRISKLVGDPGALDDVVQSAFLRAHEARRRFAVEEATDATVVAWYVAIARNTALDHVRRHTRRQRREAKAIRFDRSRWVGGAEDDTNPETQRIGHEAHTETTLRVRAALADLNLTDRALVVEHKVRGKALAELARDQGIPAVTMRVRAHRAYRRLVAALQRQPSGSELFGNSAGTVYDRERCDVSSFAGPWSLQPQPSP